MSIWEVSEMPKSYSKKMFLKLSTKDLDESTRFYSSYFDVKAESSNDKQVRFIVENPPLNLLLEKNEQATRTQGHMGIQVKSTQIVEDTMKRLEKDGFVITDEGDVECCYAQQTKTWVADPDGNSWEVFVTTEDEKDHGCGDDCICHLELERTLLASA